MQLIKVVLPTSRVMIKIFICGAARGWPRLFGFMTWQMSTITLKILITLSKTAFFLEDLADTKSADYPFFLKVQ